MNTIKYKDILRTYQRIDLYRAKYRHNDFTPHAWCFHGNKEQGWSGVCQDSFLKFNDTLIYNTTISIVSATYKYLSFKFYTPAYMPSLLRYKLILSYTTTVPYTKEIIIPYNGQLTTVFFDMSTDANWTGNITNIAFALQAETSQDVWAQTSAEVYVEYIKFDKDNVFANVLDSGTITITDFNEMRGDIETFTQQSIDWAGPDRVRQYIDTIKSTNLNEVSSRIGTLAPYNGCATCDTNTCSCDNTTYGATACQACNSCNQNQECSVCDQTCHEQARSCSCNNTCYTQAQGCTCNSTCYGYSSCTCDGSCFSCYAGNVTCSGCNVGRYAETTTCTCNASCYGYNCKYQENDKLATCDLCYKGCDAAGYTEGCRTNYLPGVGLTCLRNAGPACGCNQKCFNEGAYHYLWICDVTCYREEWVCHTADTTHNTTGCSVCDMTCNSQSTTCSSCNSGYGSSSCSSCNNICYTQPIACSCNTLCYTQARTCTCDSRCNGYVACVTCDGCDGYVACACNQTSYQDVCAQCHKTGYSTVPI